MTNVHTLSQLTHGTAHDDDVAVPMRDGVMLLADVHRPAEPGRYPVLVAASPYPRQIQNLGAPAGFIEAGASDFFVPRGYVHVIANCRGTSGSGGTFGFFDGQERRDMYDLVEWAAQQPWSDKPANSAKTQIDRNRGRVEGFRDESDNARPRSC